MTRKEKIAIRHIQYLFGHAKALYWDDRNSVTADLLVPVLIEGFELAMGILDCHTHVTPKNGETKCVVEEFIARIK